MSNLEQKKLMDIMARMRSLVSAEGAAPECTELDWSVPHHFGVKAFNQLTGLGQKLADCIETALQSICDDEFNVKVEKITEIFAGVLSQESSDKQDNCYYLPIFLRSKGQVGFLSIPFETGTTLIQQVLCDSETKIGEEGILSSLEESILQDNILLIADTLFEGIAECIDVKLDKDNELIYNDCPLHFEQTEQMFRVLFRISDESVQLEISLYLLDEIVDPSFRIPLPDITPERLKRLPDDITESVHQVGIDISVEMDSSLMALKHIFSLEKDDVLLFDHQITTPVNIVINKRASFKAWPAQSDGQLAVVIADK